MQTARHPEDRGWLKGGGLPVRLGSFVPRWRRAGTIPFRVGRSAMECYAGRGFEPCHSGFGGSYPARQDSGYCHANNPREKRAETSAGIGAFLLGVNQHLFRYSRFQTSAPSLHEGSTFAFVLMNALALTWAPQAAFGIFSFGSISGPCRMWVRSSGSIHAH